MKKLRLGVLVSAVTIAAVTMLRTRASAKTVSLSAQEAREIALETYIYAYPLVLMEITRRVSTNAEVPESKSVRAPMNQFVHVGVFPDSSFSSVVRPNVDTLYSVLWYDVSKQPLVISVPDSGGRYYLLQILDMWTDVFAAPGKRTTGTKAQVFAIVGPRWDGALPAGIREVRSPTDLGWIIGRTQTNGKADYPAVHKFQSGITATPLSHFGKPYTHPKGTVDPNLDMSAPVEQVAKMDAATFFALFAKLMKQNPPHSNDYPILAQMARIGLIPGKSFDMTKASPEVRSALEAGPRHATRIIADQLGRSSHVVNGWTMIGNPVGTYGADYTARASVAYFGLGANLLKDAFYPSISNGPDGKPFDSDRDYLIHFNKDQLPPVRAFWSVTLYNDRQLLSANPINRYALGDRDKLQFNKDGSLDIYIQRQSPGKDKESNWLPAPASGTFSLTIRLYWPKPAAFDGTWSPPPVVPTE